MRALLVSVLVFMAGAAAAKDLVWDRNTETDMRDYRVYGCQTSGCTVTKVSANLLATIPQVPAGSMPKWTLPATLVQGQLAVSARDTSLNESALSAPLMLDQVSPSAPTNLEVQ